MAHSVTIYSTPTCHFCHMAKEFFGDNNIVFTDKDVTQDQEALKEMVEKTGQMGVPVIDIDGKLMIGFDKHTIKELLGL